MINHVYGLAVRAIIIDDDEKILIIKRSANSKTNPNKWELPGGKVETNETFDQALIREVFEETNLKINLDNVAGVSEQDLHLIRAVHIIMFGNIIEGELKLSSEHDGYAWVNFDDLLDYPLADWFKSFITHEQALENNDRDKNDTAEKMKPIIKTLKKSIDNVQKKI
jgi:8-oxo-dGTP diphosphatase